MLWKKKSRFDDLAPFGWMMLGAISALTLVSLVNSVPEEKVTYGLKKVTTSTAKATENIRQNFENLMVSSKTKEKNINPEEPTHNPKIKRVQGVIKNNRGTPAI